MLVLTGAGGFIGSVLLKYLNKKGYHDIVLFDSLPQEDQYKNLIGSTFRSLHAFDDYSYIASDLQSVQCVIHVGANSNTLEKNWSKIYQQNVLSTRIWHDLCQAHSVPFIFISSAAVYGNGNGPLNAYAFSKHASEHEINGVILRLFNVYGPNEYHKGRMASTMMHWFQSLATNNDLCLYADSDQYHRDFIWVEDVCKTVLHFISHPRPGIYDVGTGQNVDFSTIADGVLQCYGSGSIKTIPMPDDLLPQYQINTKANVIALKDAGVKVDDFVPADRGIEMYWDYLRNNEFY